MKDEEYQGFLELVELSEHEEQSSDDSPSPPSPPSRRRWTQPPDFPHINESSRMQYQSASSVPNGDYPSTSHYCDLQQEPLAKGFDVLFRANRIRPFPTLAHDYDAGHVGLYAGSYGN